MSAVPVRVLRPMYHRGRPHTAGKIIEMTALEAWHAVGSMRAELVNPECDHALALEAAREQSAALVAATPVSKSWVRNY